MEGSEAAAAAAEGGAGEKGPGNRLESCALDGRPSCDGTELCQSPELSLLVAGLAANMEAIEPAKRISEMNQHPVLICMVRFIKDVQHLRSEQRCSTMMDMQRQVRRLLPELYGESYMNPACGTDMLRCTADLLQSSQSSDSSKLQAFAQGSQVKVWLWYVLGTSKV